MHVIAGLEIRVLSALRVIFIDARWTFSFASSANVPACLDGSRQAPARRQSASACTAACSRARAAGVVAELCETG